MKYFIIAGEASGDLHGSNLMRELKRKDPEAKFRFWGGDRMSAEADGLLMHYRNTTIMGFVEVLTNLGKILKNLRLCKQQIDDFKPHKVILIDFPGFNLRIARHCKQHGLFVIYYIAPKVWAWKEKRAKKLEAYVDLLILIFPFEVAYFKKWKVKAKYVGNPLLDEIAAFKPDPAFRMTYGLDKSPVVALLPGSRRQEITRMLPVMLKATADLEDHQLVVCGAPGMTREAYVPWLNDRVKVVFGQTYDVLHHSTAAIVCSGTATLETALFNVPQVCGYAGHPVSYMIAKQLVKVKFISLVNLCLNRKCITELIQDQMNPLTLGAELAGILPGGANRQKMLQDYSELTALLGGQGASEKAASLILA